VTPLHSLLLDRLSAAGSLPFAEVMELALYHPEHGYYGPGPRRLGRSGDFFTAVSVGPLYGSLLARLAQQVRAELSEPTDLVIIEQAAHDGQLAEDVLQASTLDYVIVEPNPRYEAVQRQRLAPFGNRVSWVSSLTQTPAAPALFICNELPDAMPVHLLRRETTGWEELHVALANEGRLAFVPVPISCPKLAVVAARLPVDVPEGFITEINLAAIEWMRDLAAAPFHGALYIADYGLDAEELLDSSRSRGTLRRYHEHQMDDKVLEALGQCDLTTHVNFTRLIEAAEAGGMALRSYEHQGRFLGKLALPWLASLEGAKPDAAHQALLRQYHTLTHPAFLGRSFRVLMLQKLDRRHPRDG
jgi:SAM-dependent MidA family methyltransferase